MSKRQNSDHHGQRPPPALRLRPPQSAAPNAVPSARPSARPPRQPQQPPQAPVRTLRISGIPPDITEEDFRIYLRDLLGYDGFQLSLVPSEDHAVATVTLIEGETPALLKCTPGSRIFLGYPGAERCSLVVDCDFIGATPLYSAEEPTVDLVAVTGLAGHAYGSWKSPNGPRMWLRDFLPSDLQRRGHKVRILTFGYDSALRNNAGATPSVQNHARMLLDSLNSQRRGEKERHRPIIFIGHSLGGLVIKQALVDASQLKGTYENDEAILRSCTALFFFGVPNRGLNTQNLRMLVKGQKVEYFINDLREGSELLWQSYQRFLQCELKGCQITSCYELNDTRGVVDDGSGNWTRSGEMLRVVTRESATFSLPTEAIHMQIGISADHSNMVKFSDPFDPDYKRVKDRLSECVQNSPGILEARLAKEGSKEPLYMAPMWANPCFVGREETLRRLKKLLRTDGNGQPRAAMYGLGGIGKTTIAIEFCRRWKASQPDNHIFWIHGRSHEDFKTSYLKLGQEAGVLREDGRGEADIVGQGTSRDDTSKSGLVVVKKWLESLASGNWIMIIDNFDEVDLYAAEYLPKIRGAILFTTRDKRLIGNSAYITPNAGVDVGAMSETEGTEMLTKLLSIDEAHPEDTLDLLKHLEMLPLAIEQAAGYIRETGVDVPTYVAMFKDCESNQHELLDDPLPSTNESYCEPESRAVMTTWKITFRKIRETSPDSVGLLEVMSFLSPDDIPKALLRDVPFIKYKGDVRFNQAFAPLLNFALIYRLSPSNFRLHRLVGLCIRRNMDSERPQKRNELLEAIFPLLYDCIPEEILGNFMQCLNLATHAATALQHYQESGHYSESQLRLMASVGDILQYKRDSAGALERYQRAFDGYERALGKDHPVTLGTVNNIGNVFDSQGDYDKALERYRRALEGNERALGKDHRVTLSTVNNIANVFQSQGDYDKASVWYQRALDGNERALGKDHPETLITVNNIGNVFESQGDYDKALVWYRRALEGNERALGKVHPDTLSTVNNIASVFASQGDYDKALVWRQRALEGNERALGKDHPDTLGTVNNIANVFQSQGDYDKALVWYQRALDGNERALGKDHPVTLSTANNIGNVFASQGEYDKALVSHQRALDGKERALGKDHPDTLGTVNNIANVFRSQGDYDKALVWYQRALDGKERALGKVHPDTLRTVNNIANVFALQGDYDKALVWYQRALDGTQKALGKDHPNTLRTANHIANVFRSQGDYDKALVWYQRALDGTQRALGKDHPNTLRTVSKIANVFQSQGDYAKAIEIYWQALDHSGVAPGAEVLGIANQIAIVHQLEGDCGEALVWYQRALEGYEKTLGKDHHDTLDTVKNMADAFQSQGDYSKALVWYQRALEGYERLYGKEHPNTLTMIANIADISKISKSHAGSGKAVVAHVLGGQDEAIGLNNPISFGIISNKANNLLLQGEYGKALVSYQNALDLFEKAFEKHDPRILGIFNNLAIMFLLRGDHCEAMVWYQRALEGYEKTLGKDHSTTLKIIDNMGKISDWQAHLGKASAGNQQALGNQEDAIEEDHPSTPTTAINIADAANTQEPQADPGMALAKCQQVMGVQEGAIAKNCSSIAATVANTAKVADVLESQPDSGKAVVGSQQVLAGQEEELIGEDYPGSSGPVENTSNSLLFQGDCCEALVQYQRALDGLEMALGKDDPRTLGIVENMATIFLLQPDYDKALEHFQRALKGYEKVYGKDDHRTIRAAERVSIARNYVHSPSQQMCDS